MSLALGREFRSRQSLSMETWENTVRDHMQANQLYNNGHSPRSPRASKHVSHTSEPVRTEHLQTHRAHSSCCLKSHPWQVWVQTN